MNKTPLHLGGTFRGSHSQIKPIFFLSDSIHCTSIYPFYIPHTTFEVSNKLEMLE